MLTKLEKNLIRWLFVSAVTLCLLVVVGGITRLTHSGLSIVEWKPITGLSFPSSQEGWSKIFNDYKSFPEYKIINQGMELNEFKKIFFWEYSHRMLGRLLGLILFFTFAFSLFNKKTKIWVKKRLFFMFFLVCVQGALGWYMVKSGLIKLPYVSHLRLAAHLSLAFFTLQFIWWTILDIFYKKNISQIKTPLLFSILIKIFTLILALQVVYGAFTAGLKAGFIFNTFPKMGDSWIPFSALQFNDLWEALFNNPIVVQFVHRLLAWVLIVFFIIILVLSKKYSLTSLQKKALKKVAIILLTQFALGITTLLLYVPTLIAVTHQITALFLLTATTFLLHTTKQKT